MPVHPDVRLIVAHDRASVPVLIALALTILSLTPNGLASTRPFTSRLLLSFHLSASFVIPTVDERRDQWMASMGTLIEVPLFSRHQIGVFVDGIHFRTQAGDVSLLSAGFSDRIFLHGNHRFNGPFLRWFTGAAASDRYFPGNGARLNFRSGLLAGLFSDNRTAYLEAGIEHISNGYLRDPNIGINALTVRIGFRV